MKFDNGESFFNVRNVGELKKALEQIPDETPIEQGLSDSCDVVILHKMNGEALIEFEDGDSN
ncbi:hypothetical protein GAW91_000161 [Vibrio fluvialis]|nr:hypothetical protein [Vibrio fluvialis]